LRTPSNCEGIKEDFWQRQLPPVKTSGLRTAKRDQTVDQEATNRLQQRFGYKNRRVFPWPVLLPGTPKPDVLSGALSLSRNSEGKCNPGLTGRKEYLPCVYLY